PLVAALASKLRTLAKVGAARGRGLDPARDLQLAPWQVDRARRDLRYWDADRLAQAIEAVAAADHEIKGAGRAPGFALERAVRRVAQLAHEWSGRSRLLETQTPRTRRGDKCACYLEGSNLLG